MDLLGSSVYLPLKRRVYCPFPSFLPLQSSPRKKGIPKTGHQYLRDVFFAKNPGGDGKSKGKLDLGDVEGRPRPFMVVHGQNDNVVPIGQGEILSRKAKGPEFFFKVEKEGYNHTLTMKDGAY